MANESLSRLSFVFLIIGVILMIVGTLVYIFVTNSNSITIIILLIGLLSMITAIVLLLLSK